MDQAEHDRVETASPGSICPLRAWLQLLRAPNLLTVAGDPIVGFMLAGAFAEHTVVPLRLIWAGLASVLFYCAGLVHNDLCDLAEDRRDRPDRPLVARAA